MAILTKDAAEAIRKNTKLFEAMILVGNALDELGSLDNAVAESKKRLEASKAEEAASEKAKDALEAEIKKLTGKKSEASVRAEKMLKDAEAQAKELVALANADAQGIIANARLGAQAMADESNARSLAILAAVTEKQKELDAINAEIAEKSKEKSTLQKAIDSLKAKFA